MRWARALLWVGGTSFFGFGVAFLMMPLKLYATIGIPVSGAVATTELMAFYGGLEIAVGALLVACALDAARTRDGLMLLATCYGAVGLARGAGMLATAARNDFLWIALISELALAALAVFALATFRPRAADVR